MNMHSTSRSLSRHVVLALLFVSGAFACTDSQRGGGGGGAGAVDLGTVDTGAPVAADLAGPDLEAGARDGGGSQAGEVSDDGHPDGSREDGGGASWDLGTADAGGPDGGMASCVAQLPADQPFLLVPEGPVTQIHATAAFDGHGIWIAYNVPEADGSGLFDVWALRLGCNGSRLIPPRPVQSADHGNDVDPDLAVDRERVYLAWTTDNGEAPYNMAVWYRTLHLDGSPDLAEDRPLTPWYEQEAVAANAMNARIAPRSEGRFVVAAAWGLPAAERFQVVVQRFERDGTPELRGDGRRADGILAYLEPGINQSEPTLAPLADGGLHVAWSRAPDEGPDQVVHATLTQAGRQLQPRPPVEAVPRADSAGPVLAAAPDGSGQVFLAFHRVGPEMDVFVQDARALEPEAPYLVLGEPRKPDHSPALAVADGAHGAVAWYRTRVGIRNDLWLRGFAYDGERLTAAGEPRLVNPGDETSAHDALPYQPALVHLGENAYLLIWSEGVSPELWLMARFVRL